MAAKNPNETMGQLIAAINGGEPERALTLYEQNAVFVIEPGKFAVGKNAIRDAHAGFAAAKSNVTIKSHATLKSGDLALYSTKWSLTGIGSDNSSVKMNGKGGVILRRQLDGNWRIVIENPWTDALPD